MLWLDSIHETVVEALTQGVRVLSFDQVARLVASGSDTSFSLIESLEKEGFVSVETRLVAVPERIARPVLAWQPGNSTPDFGPVAYELRSRKCAVEERRLILPTAKACKHFGGSRVRPRASEWSHDLLMSEVYLQYQKQLEDQDNLRWTSSDSLRSDGEALLFGNRVPDACLRSPDGKVEKILEAGGSGYNREKLSRLHESYCGFAYELY